MKSKNSPSACASLRISMASSPLARNFRPGGSAIRRDARTSFRDPLPEPGQRVADFLPGIGKMHGIDTIRYPVRTAHMLALNTGSVFAFLFLASLVERSGPDPAPPPAALPRRLVQALRRELPHLAHRCERRPPCPLNQPPRLIRRPF